MIHKDQIYLYIQNNQISTELSKYKNTAITLFMLEKNLTPSLSKFVPKF